MIRPLIETRTAVTAGTPGELSSAASLLSAPTINAVKPSPRILISRLSAVGDCVQTLPVLCALREYFPDAYIAWAVQPAAAQLIEGHPCLNQLIVVRRHWLKSLRAVWCLRRQLRKLKFDITIDPQGLTESAMIARLSKAKQRIGFTRGQAREMAPWLNNHLIKPTTTHVVDRYLELLRPLGVYAPKVRFDLREDEKAHSMAAAFQHDAGLEHGFVAINPGAGWDSRLWPVGRFGEVAWFLGKKHGLTSVVLWAGQREQLWAQQIVASSGGHAIVAPKTNLLELAAVLRVARLCVGSDTGPLHLAAAVGTPSVGLHGPTRPEDSGPYGPEHIALQKVYLAGTRRERRGANNDAMRAIRSEIVCHACDEILNRPAVKASDKSAA